MLKSLLGYSFSLLNIIEISKLSLTFWLKFILSYSISFCKVFLFFLFNFMTELLYLWLMIYWINNYIFAVFTKFIACDYLRLSWLEQSFELLLSSNYSIGFYSSIIYSKQLKFWSRLFLGDYFGVNEVWWFITKSF